MYISKTIKTDIITVTPDIARELLEQNTKNRRISKVNYSKVLEAMSNGEWELNGEAIKIARDGRVLDGQHRLMVAANNDLTFQTLIVYGLEDETQSTMDTGKSRTIADVLSIHGYENASRLAAIVTGIIRKERWGLKAGVYSHTSGYPVTAKQVLERIEEEPSLTELTVPAARMMKAGLSSRLAGVLYYVFSEIDQEDADDFFSKLETGELLERGNPILTLRNALINMKESMRGTRSQTYMAAITIKAWNKYRAGEEATQLRFTPGGKTPERFPKPI